MENRITFGFIGAGNMGGALARAVVKSCGGDAVFIADVDAEKARSLSLELGCRKSSSEEICKICDYIILGVKPQVMPAVLGEISPILRSRKFGFTLVSMAASLSNEKILGMLGSRFPIIRIMPNTPASIGMGMILYSPLGADNTAVEVFKDAFAFAGRLELIDEKLIDAASAVSGCGPAFVYMFAEALADGGVECGLPRDKAMLFAAQTIAGAAQLLLKSGEHPGSLKDKVCSPGGTTIAGVHALESGAFRATAMNAVKAAYDKTLALK